MVMTLGVGGRAFTEVSQVDSRNLHRTRIASRDTSPQREVLSRAARDLTPCPGSRAFVFATRARRQARPGAASAPRAPRFGGSRPALRGRCLDRQAVQLHAERREE